MTDHITAEEARNQRELIINRLMPELAETCSAPPVLNKNVIVLTECAFGDSPREMELMGLAIRYATDRGYIVHVVPYKTKP